MMKSTKNQARRNLIIELVMANMETMRKHLKVTGEINKQRYLLLYELLLELAPPEAISKVTKAFEKQGMFSADYKFDVQKG